MGPSEGTRLGEVQCPGLVSRVPGAVRSDADRSCATDMEREARVAVDALGGNFEASAHRHGVRREVFMS